MTSDELYYRADGSVIGTKAKHKIYNASRRTIRCSDGLVRRIYPSHPDYPELSAVRRRPLVVIPGANAEFDTRVRARRDRLYRPADAEWDASAEGYVYITARRGVPGRVKIGHSADPKARISGANTFLGPDEEVYLVQQWLVTDRKASERWIHRYFDQFRIGNKEVFAIDADRAVRAIEDLIIEEEAQYEDPVRGP